MTFCTFALRQGYEKVVVILTRNEGYEIARAFI